MSAWPLIALLAVVSAGILLWPLLRPARRQAPRLDHDLAVYRDQLAELEADQATGAVSATEAGAARREIERRILRAADAPLAGSSPSAAPKVDKWPLVALISLLPILAGLLYAQLGAPAQPAAPSAPVVAKPAGAGAPDKDLVALVEKLAAKLKAEPGDREGWLKLGQSYVMLERPTKAAQAFAEALAIDPNDAKTQADMAEMLVAAASGQVGTPALAAFKRAHELDPKLAPPRYFIALYDYQKGRPQAAFDRWLTLYRELPPNDPRRGLVRRSLDGVASQLGIDLAKEIGDTPAGMSEEQWQRARGMVAGLAARLEIEPEDLKGWLRLGKSYGVLKEWPKAADAYAKAAGLAPKDVAVLVLWARALSAQQPNAPVPASAVAVYRRIFELSPEHGEALWFLGLDAAYNERRGEALALWRALLQHIPKDSRQHGILEKAIARAEKGEPPF